MIKHWVIRLTQQLLVFASFVILLLKYIDKRK